MNAELDFEISSYLEAFFRTVADGVAYREDSRLVEDLGLDSLDFTALLTGMEDRWGLAISEADIAVDRFATVAAVRAYVHSATRGPGRAALT